MESLYKIWPALSIVFAVTLIFSAPFRLWSKLDTVESTPNRIRTLDGLRGYLAIAVMLHHDVIRIGQMKTGIWQLPPSRFYAMLGQVGVAMFFMITGYLFWKRISERELSLSEWLRFFINRFFRIVPLYWLVVALYALIVLMWVRFHVSSISLFIGYLVGWLSFNTLHTTFWLENITEAIRVLPQTWTLGDEWIFYLCLPLLAIVARKSGALVICVVALLMVNHSDGLLVGLTQSIVAFFLCGAITASVQLNYPKVIGNSIPRNILACCFIAAAFHYFDTAYAPTPVLLLGAGFFLIASGASLFGALHLKASQRLGHISYSIYLLHGLTMTFLTFHSTLGPFAMESPTKAWIIISLAAAGTLLLSAATYVFVERPGIALGKRVARLVS